MPPRRGAALALLLLLAGVFWYGRRRYARGSLHRTLLTWVYGLRPFTHSSVRQIDTVQVPMRDGIKLSATLLLPGTRAPRATAVAGGYDDAAVDKGGAYPCLLVRTPYNRFFATFLAKRFAERGYAVLVQDTRGRFESDGTFEPLGHELRDGIDTVRWVGEQSWVKEGKSGRKLIASWGISYLAFTQYSIVAAQETERLQREEALALAGSDSDDDALATLPKPVPPLTALVPVFGASNVYETVYGDRTLSLEMLLRWLHLTHFIGGEGHSVPRPRTPPGLLDNLYLGLAYGFKQDGAVARAAKQVSLRDAHEAAFGQRELLVPLEADEDAVYWRERDHSRHVAACPPTHVMAGWFDIFLRQSLRDFASLQAAATGAVAERRHGSRKDSLGPPKTPHWPEPAPLVDGDDDLAASGSSRGSTGSRDDDGPFSFAGDASTDAAGAPLQDPSRPPRAFLTIGPWHHFESLHIHVMPHILDESLAWLDHHMYDAPRPQRHPVRLFIMDGHPDKGEWREFEEWPPLARATEFYLKPGGRLCPQHHRDALDPHFVTSYADGGGDGFRDDLGPAKSAPSTFVYDPEDPTPSPGGTRFHPREPAAVDHRAFETRSDVLVFTTNELESDLEVIGFVTLDLYVRCVGGSTADYVGRLCDVHPDGKSVNMCDGIARIRVVDSGAGVRASGSPMTAGGGENVRRRRGSRAGVAGAGAAAHSFADEDSEDRSVQRIKIDMWATAARFKAGHRLRLHVCGGAHPRWMRNPGTLSGDPVADAQTLIDDTVKIEMVATTNYIYHDATRPSALVLPLAGASLSSRGSVSKALNLAGLPHTASTDVKEVVGSLMTRVSSISDFALA